LYSRFIHKFLYDQGYVTSPEPFAKLVHQGMVLGSDGRKMGKRYGNGVDPLDVVDKYGSDAVRTYLMFMGPVEQDKIRSDETLHGIKRYLERVARIVDYERFGTGSDLVDSEMHATIQ
jgi:leucyl-tRNA synthetase